MYPGKLYKRIRIQIKKNFQKGTSESIYLRNKISTKYTDLRDLNGTNGFPTSKWVKNLLVATLNSSL